MKHNNKLLGLFLLAVILTSVLCACADSSSKNEVVETTEAAADTFYTVENNDRTLRISLENDPASGYSWSYKISDPSIINLTAVQIVTKTDDAQNSKEMWVADFGTSGQKFGDVKLELYYLSDADDISSSAPVYTLDLDVAATSKISVKSVTE